MAKTVLTLVQQSLSGDGWGSSSPLYANTQENDAGLAPYSVTLVSGNNTIAVPATALGVIIVPPAGSTVAKTIKGAAGDTGIALAPAQPTAIPFTAAAVASFIIDAGAGETVQLLWQ